MQEFCKSHLAWKPCLQLHWDTHSCHCWFTFSFRDSWVKSERGPVLREGKERPRKEANHSTLVGGRLNTQENLLRKLVLVDLKISRFPHLPARILKVSLEASTVFSPMCLADSRNTSLSQGYVLGTAYTVGSVRRAHIPRTGEGRRSLRWSRSISQDS